MDRDAPLRIQIANNLKAILKEKDLSQVELSIGTGISKSTISDYVRAATMMKVGNLEKIADFLRVRKSDIDPTFFSNYSYTTNFVGVPVIGKISAGEPIFAEENINGFLPVSYSVMKSSTEYFFLEVHGDSMNLEFSAGSMLLIEKTPNVTNGQIAVVRVNGYDTTVKKIALLNDSITLIPLSTNPIHQPHTYSFKDTEIEVVGRVIQAIKNY